MLSHKKKHQLVLEDKIKRDLYHCNQTICHITKVFNHKQSVKLSFCSFVCGLMMNTNSFPDDLMLSAVYVARRLWTMCLWIHGQAKQSMSKCEWDNLSSFSIPLQQSVSLFLCFPSSPLEINYNLVDWQKWQCFPPHTLRVNGTAWWGAALRRKGTVSFC